MDFSSGVNILEDVFNFFRILQVAGTESEHRARALGQNQHSHQALGQHAHGALACMKKKKRNGRIKADGRWLMGAWEWTVDME
jgi:hypothetical protein